MTEWRVVESAKWRNPKPAPVSSEHSQSPGVKLRRKIADIVKRGDGTRMGHVLKALEKKLAALNE